MLCTLLSQLDLWWPIGWFWDSVAWSLLVVEVARNAVCQKFIVDRIIYIVQQYNITRYLVSLRIIIVICSMEVQHIKWHLRMDTEEMRLLFGIIFRIWSPHTLWVKYYNSDHTFDLCLSSLLIADNLSWLRLTSHCNSRSPSFFPPRNNVHFIVFDEREPFQMYFSSHSLLPVSIFVIIPFNSWVVCV